MKLVIFDCDGTLVDSQHMIVAAMSTAFAAAGLAPLPRREVLSIVGLSLPLAVARLLPDAEPAVVEAVADGYRDAFQALRQSPDHHEPLYEGILELVHELDSRPDHVLAIATGKSRRGVNALFDRMDLHGVFASVQTADTHPSKPDPSMIMSALRETGVAVDRAVMIGDTTFDMEMACRAGVVGIGVSWGYHSVRDLRVSGAVSVVDDARGLGLEIDRAFGSQEKQ